MINFPLPPHNPGVNYQLLLAKYIEHVASIEGTTFIYECQTDPLYSSIVFTEQEIEELNHLAQMN